MQKNLNFHFAASRKITDLTMKKMKVKHINFLIIVQKKKRNVEVRNDTFPAYALNPHRH